MDRHTCKLCFRRFHNGRALGGHMRSHVMAATVTAAAYSPPPLPRPQSPPLSLASTSSTEMDGKPVASCGLREGAKKRSRIGAPEFSGGVAAGGESSVVQDGESDTESSPRFAVSRRRSKRARRRVQPRELLPDPEQPASSVSDATPEEDVAMSLVMLSRDSWTRSRSGPEHHWAQASSEAEQNNGDDADEAEHGHDDVARPRGRHQCGACKKVFRSYQALGGHRAIVKKGKGGCVPVPVPLPPPTPPPAAQPSKARRAGNSPVVIHECPFCSRVFESGQALGGHKRTHMPYAGAPAPSTPAKCGDSSGSFDLNVPAAVDDDFELSAVYDAEFGSSTRQ